MRTRRLLHGSFVLALVTSISRMFPAALRDEDLLRPHHEIPLPIQSSSSSSEAALLRPDDTKSNPSNLDNEESFSACLLVMDDNHRLSEWIAYHYHVLPLRHLVLAVDPRSRTRPETIVNQWKPYMNITIWDDASYDFTKTGENNKGIPVETNRHRVRQRHFYRACTQHLQRQNRTWTTYHDTDEFLALNSKLVNHERLRQPGSVLAYLKGLRLTSSASQSMSIHSAFYHGPCIALPRILYSAVESNLTDQQDVPVFVNPRQFETLRWRYRTRDNDIVNNLKAKAIMDVSQLPVLPKLFEVHRPIKAVCPSPNMDLRRAPIVVHHYLGSWETYSFRNNDARKGQEKNRWIWEYRSQLVGGGVNDEVRPWIQGFCDFIGEAHARVLLRDAGLPANHRSDDPHHWDAAGKWVENVAQRDADYAAFLEQRRNKLTTRVSQ